MTGFCAQCTEEVRGLPASENDLQGLCEPGQVVSELCEGCEYAVVDHEGRCIEHAKRGETRYTPHEGG